MSDDDKLYATDDVDNAHIMLRTTLARLPRAGASAARARSFAASSAPRDIIKKLEESLTPREAVERKRKEFEAKYGDKLKQKVEA